MSGRDDRPPHAVPGDHVQPSNRPIDEEAVSVELEGDDGETGRIAQEPSGPDVERGGGEWPAPGTPPSGPAPGAAGVTPDRGAPRPVASNTTSGDLSDEIDPPEGFKDVLDADRERGGSATTRDDGTGA